MLQRGLRWTGETRGYFIAGRIALLRSILPSDLPARRILDFGCGNGEATPRLSEAFGGVEVLGVDASAEAIESARRNHREPALSFATLEEVPAEKQFGLVYAANVFHHIGPEERRSTLDWISARLADGGYFAMFENNPWNPGTRFVMRRVAFDDDAVPIPPPAALRMLRAVPGLEIARTRSLFWFPSPLSALRRLERLLDRVPFGGQYLALAKKVAGG